MIQFVATDIHLAPSSELRRLSGDFMTHCATSIRVGGADQPYYIEVIVGSLPTEALTARRVAPSVYGLGPPSPGPGHFYLQITQKPAGEPGPISLLAARGLSDHLTAPNSSPPGWYLAWEQRSVDRPLS